MEDYNWVVLYNKWEVDRKEEYNRVVLYKWQRRISATQQLEASANSRATTPLYGQPTLRHPGKE